MGRELFVRFSVGVVFVRVRERFFRLVEGVVIYCY